MTDKVDIEKLKATMYEYMTKEYSERLGKWDMETKSDASNVTVVVATGIDGFGIVQNRSKRGLFEPGMTVRHPLFNEYPVKYLVNCLCSVKGDKLTVLSVVAKRDQTMEGGKVEASGMVLHWNVIDDNAKTRKETPVVEEVVKDSPTLGYYINAEARLVFTSAKALSDARPERAVKVMMVGPSGYGKTTLPRIFSERTAMNFMRMNCATIRDPEEWFGYREAVDGSTVFIRSQFAKAIEKGNLVVILDEFNRLEPWLHNTLFPLLDDDGCTVVHDEEFRIGPNVIVVGTINTGYRYTGTFELDEALYNRFDLVLEVGAMPHNDEVNVLTSRTGIERTKANDLVKMATRLRTMNVVCSTRTTLLIASMVEAGMTMREAFESAVVKRIPVDNTGVNLRKQAVDAINVNIGVLSERRVTNDVFEMSGEAYPIEDVSVVTITVNLHANGRPFQLALAISTLRKLDVYGGQLSQKDAFKIADELRGGVPQEITLTRGIDEALITALFNAGIDVTPNA